MSDQEEVEKLKAEAQDLLEGMFGIPEGFSSGQVRRAVDAIVSAAVLETALIMKDAFKSKQEGE